MQEQTFALPLLVQPPTSIAMRNRLSQWNSWLFMSDSDQFREHQLIASSPEGILAKKQTLTSNYSFSLSGSYTDGFTGYTHAFPKTTCEILHPEYTLVII